MNLSYVEVNKDVYSMLTTDNNVYFCKLNGKNLKRYTECVRINLYCLLFSNIL